MGNLHDGMRVGHRAATGSTGRCGLGRTGPARRDARSDLICEHYMYLAPDMDCSQDELQRRWTGIAIVPSWSELQQRNRSQWMLPCGLVWGLLDEVVGTPSLVKRGVSRALGGFGGMQMPLDAADASKLPPTAD